MRYRFKGLLRETGKPVEGHVTAPSEPIAYEVMSDNGVVAEALWPDPVIPVAANGNANANENANANGSANANGNGHAAAPAPAPVPGEPGQVSQALDSALDSSARQVSMDDLSQRYKGKNVWVLDRNKIRDRVKVVVDRILSKSLKQSDSGEQTRERVSEALEKMFANNQNISSQASAGTIAMEEQINRLTKLVTQLEGGMATMNTQLRRLALQSAAGGGGGGGGGGGPRRGFFRRNQARNEGNDEVLLEIFKTNLDLKHAATGAPPAAASDPAPAPTTEASSN